MHAKWRRRRINIQKSSAIQRTGGILTPRGTFIIRPKVQGTLTNESANPSKQAGESLSKSNVLVGVSTRVGQFSSKFKPPYLLSICLRAFWTSGPSVKLAGINDTFSPMSWAICSPCDADESHNTTVDPFLAKRMAVALANGDSTPVISATKFYGKQKREVNYGNIDEVFKILPTFSILEFCELCGFWWDPLYVLAILLGW